MDDSEPQFLGTDLDFEQPMTADAVKTLKKVCFKFRNILHGKMIRIFIMPYIPLADAYHIHELVNNPGRIQLADDVDVATGYGVDRQALPIPGRTGVLELYDPQVDPDGRSVLHLNFTVLNYGLLWAKASEHCEFIGTCNQAKELISQMENHKQHIMQDPKAATAILSADLLQNLEERIDETKLDFLLSLHRHGIDPHDSIHAMDAELHEELYDPAYDPCYPEARTEDVMVQATQAAAELYMQQLEDIGHQVYEVNKAKLNIMKAEGAYEAEAHYVDSIKQFCNAIETCTKQLQDSMNRLKIFDTRPTFIGVVGHEREL